MILLVNESVQMCLTYHSISESKLVEQSLCSGREGRGGCLACMDWLFAFSPTLTARERGGGREGGKGDNKRPYCLYCKAHN